ncbi:hypothetical protein P4C99_16320 [Pontiellaceae bacterium B1224]|nr:hypothetical protein [Pontiellaceae bacterium B1224]
MNTSTPCRIVSRRFFVGCSSISVLPLIGFGNTASQNFTVHSELEQRVSRWVKDFSDSMQVSVSRQGIPEYRVELNRDQWSGFYQSLAETFESPRIGKNNLIELHSGAHSVRLHVA